MDTYKCSRIDGLWSLREGWWGGGRLTVGFHCLHSGVLAPVRSRGVGGSGHGYNSSLKPAGGGAESQLIDFHHPRFRFLMAPRAPRAPSVSSGALGPL